MPRRYLFSDESGDLTFARGPSVSRYFAVATLLVDEADLGVLRATMAALRDDLAFRNHGLDSYFHAAQDTHEIRQVVFKTLAGLNFQVDVTLLDKPKAQPKVRPDQATFFQYAWYYHLKWLAPKVFRPGDEALIVAAETRHAAYPQGVPISDRERNDSMHQLPRQADLGILAMFQRLRASGCRLLPLGGHPQAGTWRHNVLRRYLRKDPIRVWPLVGGHHALLLSRESTNPRLTRPLPEPRGSFVRRGRASSSYRNASYLGTSARTP